MKCKFCQTETVENAKFCHECSGIINEKDYEGVLGIDITPEDITEYIVTGKLQKTIEVGAHIKAVICTLRTGEHKSLNKMVDSATDQMTSKSTYDLELRHHTLAYSVQAINGFAWPADFDKRLSAAEGLGTEIADILINRINMLHLAIGNKIQLKDF